MKKFTLFLTLAVAMANMPAAAMQRTKNALAKVGAASVEAARSVVDELTDGALSGQKTQQTEAPKAAPKKQTAAEIKQAAVEAFDGVIAETEAQAKQKAARLEKLSVAANRAMSCTKYTAITAGTLAATAATAAALAYWYAPVETCAQAAAMCATSGNMICQSAMDTCAPYVAQQSSFWHDVLVILAAMG